MATFDEMFVTLTDPSQQLLFKLSFYEAFMGGLEVRVKEIEKSCYRSGNEKCVSLHDEYVQQQAALQRQKHRAAQELLSNCRDWRQLHSLRDGDLREYLLKHPDCARPHVEKYVSLAKQEVDMMTEAQQRLGTFLH